MRVVRNWLIGLGVIVAMAISIALVIRSLPDDEAARLEQAAKSPPPAQAPAVTARPEPATPANKHGRTEEAAKSERPPEPSPAPPAAPPLSTMQGRATELLAIPPAGVIGGQSPPSTAVIANGRLQFTSAQEDRVRYVLMSHNVMQSEAPDFPLQLGGAVPEDVRLAPLPIEISDIVPNYRDYAYVISQNRIVIVTVDSRTISSLIPIEARG